MSTHTEKLPVQPPKPGPHDPDEFRGAFGFFRRYQKLILYTAVLFALVTFSVTGPLLDWVRGLSAADLGKRPTITIGGQVFEVTIEDHRIGGALANHFPNGLPEVMPDISLGNERNDLPERFAILRRASLVAGIDVSMDEVERAIEWDTRRINEAQQSTQTPIQLARMRGMGSMAQYREMVKELMRIGNFVLLESLGVARSDAAVMEQLREDREKITLKVATFDMKALEERLKAESPATEEQLRAWLEAKDEAEKGRLQVYDTNRVSMLVGLARYDGEQAFDPAQWTAELENFEVGEERRRQLYNELREVRFKKEDDTYREFEDAEVTAELTTIAQVDEVLNKVLQKVLEANREALKPLSDELMETLQARARAQQDADAARAEAEAAPEDEEKQAAARQAEERLESDKRAADEAQAALDRARAGFDFRAAFEAQVKGEDGALKSGFEVAEVTGLKNAKELEDLSGIGLGTWKSPTAATNLQRKGDIMRVPGKAEHGGFLLMITDIEVRPLRPWPELQESLEEAWFIEKAKEVGGEQKKKLEEELKRLAREQVPEEVAAIEQKQEPQVEERFAAWEAARKQELEKAERMLAEVPPGTEPAAAWQQERDRLVALLEAKEEERARIAEAVQKEIEAEVAELLRKQYGKVFEAAVAATGFEVETIGPYDRRLAETHAPEFRYERFPRTVLYLWRMPDPPVADLDEGEATDILEDVQERRWQIALCTAEEPLTEADIPRRSFAAAQRTFGWFRMRQAIAQSFTLDALKQRYKYIDPVAEQRASAQKGEPLPGAPPGAAPPGGALPGGAPPGGEGAGQGNGQNDGQGNSTGGGRDPQEEQGRGKQPPGDR